MNTDCIEKKIVLKAPLGRVWRALADAGEFGSWFGFKFQGAFKPGVTVPCEMVGTTVDPEVAKLQTCKGLKAEIVIERMEPERLFAFRWHPFATDPTVDYSKEPMTLVSFELAQAADGVHLTVTESGFDSLPPERRQAAFAANDGGWGIMVQVLEKFVGRAEHVGA